ncbi:MAG TPA: translation initiation factor IF-1 [Verrucomicrobiota bacterium]|nr:translation initiation factor IF-1 [Verrucomicrobiota bacterium]
MGFSEAISVEGVIIEVLSERVCKIKLENGHSLMAYKTRNQVEKEPDWKVGEVVEVEVSPFDLTKGHYLKKI